MSDDWSHEAQSPWSRVRDDGRDRGVGHVRFNPRVENLSPSPMLEERYPRRRPSSIPEFRRPYEVQYPPTESDEHCPRRPNSSSSSIDDYPRDHYARRGPRRRRSSTLNEHPRHRRRSSSAGDYPRHYHHHLHDHHYPRPIILPPLPAHHRRKSSKKRLYFVRPHGGHAEHRRGAIDRFKDAFTGEGPDVFVTSTTRERLVRDRPQQWQWSGYGLDSDEIETKIVEPGFAWSELEPVREAPWATRERGERYDFATRKFGRWRRVL